MNELRKIGTGCLLAVVTAGFLLLPAADASAARKKSVVNGGWKITWGGGTATARNVKSKEEKVLFESVQPKSEEGDRDIYEMRSVVGTIVSYSNTWYSAGGAHPSYGERWSSVNLDGSEVSLAALFGEKALFDRLMLDPVVQMAAGGGMAEKAGPPKSNPRNLTQLLEQADGGCFASMGERLLTDFHFVYRLGGNIAVVQIGLTHGCEVSRGNFLKLNKLYLPIPKALRADIARAVRNGVLKDRPFRKTSFSCAKAETTVEFTICTDKKLAGLDVAMAKRYKAARKAATGGAITKVEDDQREWLKNRNRECSWPGNEKLYEGRGEFFGSIEACLTKYYEVRLAALK